MNTITIDIKTRSCASIKTHGIFVYAQNKSTQVICVTVKKNSEPPVVWLPPELRRPEIVGISDDRLRQYLVNRCPKIGNDLPEVDEIGVEVYEFIRAELKKHTTCCGATFHPSFFAWIQHGYFGRVAAASPDGVSVPAQDFVFLPAR